MPKVVVLHTNDLHGHLAEWRGWEGNLKGRRVGGLGRLAAGIAQARQEAGDDVLLLDAGDLIGDSMIADLTRGEALIQAFNHLRYDALTIGNHEPDFGTETLRRLIDNAAFSVVAANVVWRHDRSPFTKPFVLKKVAGVTVGVLGLAYPKTPWTTARQNIADIEFLDPISAAETYLPEMRAGGAEVAVVLSHLGLSGDKNLAQSVRGVDVIVGGHSHNRMSQAEVVNGTLIVQAGAHGSDLGRLDLEVNDGRVTAHQRVLTPLDHESVPTEPDAERLLEDLLRPHRTKLDEVVGEAKGWLIRAQTMAGQEARKRHEESPIDSLFADILRNETGADFGLLPGVGYGVAIPPGPFTASQLRQLIPHDGKVVTLKLAGAYIVEVFEQAVENVHSDDPEVKVGGMVQISGLRFHYDSRQPKGHRVWHVERIGGEWEPSAEYVVATNTMMAGGGHNYDTLANAERNAEHGSQYEMIRRWLARNGPVVTPPLGRIRAEKEPER